MLHMKNVLKVSNTGQQLSGSLRNKIHWNGWLEPSDSSTTDRGPNLKNQQCDESMEFVQEDLWNLACGGSSDPEHQHLTYP